jgi:hypothetical protein
MNGDKRVMEPVRNVEEPEKNIMKVSLTGVDIPMRDMALFMLKWAVASIPAFLIFLSLILLFFYMCVGRFFCPF